MTQGTCLCGAVRYEVAGPFSMMANCHCSMCRKHHGAMFATFVGAPLDGFRWLSGQEQVSSYASSSGGTRSVCRVCGSVTPLLLEQYGLVFCSAGNLEGDLGLKPQSHIFVGSKAPWYTITDDLPQHAEYPPGFDVPSVPRPQVTPKEGIIQGSCLCGDVAYELEGKPMRVMNCHCSRCRRARSAAHATNAFFKTEQFRWVRGAEQVVEYKVPEARFFGVAFCGRCGGATARFSRERGMVSVPAGALDSDPQMQPVAHIFVGSKASWFDIADQLPQFAEMPPQ